ncbi:methionine ABC transporter permease [Gemelliphila asaccharolytica]|uniref:D-methionine transport system permease protein MetI n=1 Tax=Gemelliphila asaccharolytica TaxID=502393 RepID=A0ABR5TNC2_9BACL|nr:ABC transporter permease subunit [Gemella asaccharolytica]KXB58903.1 putative D-methionine transport system permease protein MetI [Gemella asaccharolytica]
MINLIQKYQNEILISFMETNFMLFISMTVCLVLSIPLGILLFSLNKEYLLKNSLIYELLSIILNMLRSVPFLIFIFILIPLNRFLFGTAFGNLAATLPLALVSISIYTRFVEQALLNVSHNIVDRAISMGANKFQIIRYFLLPSIKIDLILSFTSVAISTLSYSTVMGVIGAGGLGEFAYRFGYQDYNYPLMYLLVIIFIIYVYIIQLIGYYIANKVVKK